MASEFSHTTRALAARSAAPALWAWAIAALLLAAWALWFGLARVELLAHSPRARLEVQRSSHALAADLPGRVATSRLLIGQPVQAGELLVQLDDAPLQARLREADAHRQALRQQLLALQAELATQQRAQGQRQQALQAQTEAAALRLHEAAAAADFARDQARRLRADAQAGGVAEVDALQAEAEARRSAAARDALHQDNRRLQADGGAQAAQQAALAQALQRQQAALQGELDGLAQAAAGLQAEIARHALRAPVAGRIGESLPLRPGEVVAAGQRLASIVPEGELAIVADFEPAAVLGRVRPGQPARLRLAGFPWAQYGTVDAVVSRVATELRDGLVRVECRPAAQALPGLPLQHGLPGTLEVAVGHSSPAGLLLRGLGRWLGGEPAAMPGAGTARGPGAGPGA